jgi:hypothetical protein
MRGFGNRPSKNTNYQFLISLSVGNWNGLFRRTNQLDRLSELRIHLTYPKAPKGYGLSIIENRIFIGKHGIKTWELKNNPRFSLNIQNRDKLIPTPSVAIRI